LAEKIKPVVQCRAAWPLENIRSGRSLAAVEPPTLDAIRVQSAVGIPPPTAGCWLLEVDEALALMVVGRWPPARRYPLVTIVEQEALLHCAGVERRAFVHNGILMGNDAKSARLKRGDRCPGLWEHARLVVEAPDRTVPTFAVAVRRQKDQCVTGKPLVTERCRKHAHLIRPVEMPSRLQVA
jgi:hypothetical protein